MNNRWATLIAAALVAFASLVITWQFRHYDGRENDLHESLAQSFLLGKQLAGTSNIADRSSKNTPTSGVDWYYDLVLPKDARVFMTDMTGPANGDKIGLYFFASYYLFPREIGASADQPTRVAYNEILGGTFESDQEILAHGFDIRFDVTPRGQLSVKALRDLPMKFPGNPAWFDSGHDKMIAFLLPWLTALAGMWLFRFLFSPLSGQMPLREQLACGLGLGMMAVAALTLGVKLCGFHGRGLILTVTALGAMAEIWRQRKVYWTGITGGSRKLAHSPGTMAIGLAGLLVFLVLFWLAGLQGITEFDAVMAWLLKAKILHLYTGNELVQWFSNARFSHSHLDYPTLVPSLHAATFDSLGHVDEFVTKFWPAWMLLFLLVALAALNRAGNNWRHVVSFALLGLLLLPATQMYVQMEGSTLPMIFFTVLGFVQCALWLMNKNRVRLGLGLTLLFGAAMTKFEGFIFLALVGGWMLLLPSARPSLKPSPGFWRMLAFCFLAALPFLCLRVRIPSVDVESGWAGYALHHPGITLSHWPIIFIILLARLFLSPDFANWNGEGGQLHWVGRWDGFSSLYNHSTLGLAWFCLLMTVALWLAVPARRQVIVWTLAMFVGALAAFSGVFTSFISHVSLASVITYTREAAGGRYLAPVLLAWFATMITVFFAELPSASVANRSFPELKHGRWLVMGAVFIIALGVFVLPENESSPTPENPLPGAAATGFLNHSETNAPENTDLQAKIELATQLELAGKFAEAVQADREAVRLYPDNPVALNNLAWNLTVSPRPELRNGREAVQLAGKAVELTGGRQPVFIGTLAAAYAEDGQFAKAVEMAEKARNLALLNCQLEIAAKNEQLLKLYSAGKAIGPAKGP